MFVKEPRGCSGFNLEELYLLCFSLLLLPSSVHNRRLKYFYCFSLLLFSSFVAPLFFFLHFPVPPPSVSCECVSVCACPSAPRSPHLSASCTVANVAVESPHILLFHAEQLFSLFFFSGCLFSCCLSLSRFKCGSFFGLCVFTLRYLFIFLIHPPFSLSTGYVFVSTCVAGVKSSFLLFYSSPPLALPQLIHSCWL